MSSSNEGSTRGVSSSADQPTRAMLPSLSLSLPAFGLLVEKSSKILKKKIEASLSLNYLKKKN